MAAKRYDFSNKFITIIFQHDYMGGCELVSASSGLASMASGGKFWRGFATGAVSSLISSGTEGLCLHYKIPEGWTKAAIVAAGTLSGGVTASMAGGSFWDGVCNGLICAGLNHAMHLVVGGGMNLLKILQQQGWTTQSVSLKGVGILPGDSDSGFGVLHLNLYKMDFALALSPDGKQAILAVMSCHTNTVLNDDVIPIAGASLRVNGDVVQELSITPSSLRNILPGQDGGWTKWQSVGYASFDVPQESVVRLEVTACWNAFMGCGYQPVMGVNTNYMIPFPTGKSLTLNHTFYIRNSYGWSMSNGL